jgi:hypothetical protein
MNNNLYESLGILEEEIVDLAWNENNWHVKPVYNYSSDGKIQSLTFEIEGFVSHKNPPKNYPKDKTQYADPKNYKYPLNNEKRVRAAWSYINMPKNQKGYSSSELAAIKARIKKAGKKYGITFSD